MDVDVPGADIMAATETAEDDGGAIELTSSRWLRIAGIPVAIFLATRVAQLIALALITPAGGPSLRTRLLSWDAGWFINVAQYGYPHGYTIDSTGAVVGNGLAFFPLYPLLIDVGHVLGASYGWSALIVAWLAGAAAAILLAALGRDLALAGRLGSAAAARPNAVAYALVALLCTQPMSVVLSMGYSESLFIALVAGSLLALHRRAWLVAGLLAVGAGLTRATGAALAVALAVAAVVRIVDRSTSRRERLAAAIAALAALASVPAYVGWVGLRVGDLKAWFTIQTAGWGTTFDYGRSTWSFVTSTLGSGDSWVAMSVVIILAAALVATIAALVRRTWWPLAIYGVISFLLVIGQAGFYHSKPRLLVPALLVLFPAAAAAARTTWRRAAVWITLFAVFGMWYGAYMVSIWRYAI